MSNILDSFHPYANLAKDLMRWLPDVTDGSHDISHVARVWRFAQHIQLQEGGDALVLFASAMLHDCVHTEKSDPERRWASRRSAMLAAKALREQDWPLDRIDEVRHAIEAHSVSAGVAPRSIEARILADADRLDSTGAIGVARCFYVAGRIGSALYDPADPSAIRRQTDDLSFALDHFQERLLCDFDAFHTQSAKALAKSHLSTIAQFRNQFLAELQGATIPQIVSLA